MTLPRSQAQSPPRSSSTYTEFQLIKALDDWIFQAYGISQPVHQKVIRYWARRINNNPKMKRQIRQGETVGVKDATTADKVECCVKVVEECRRLAMKVGLLSYQRRHNQIGVWVMYFDCMIKPKPTEIEDDEGVITGVFDQAEKDESESSQVHECEPFHSHLSKDAEADNTVTDSVPEIDDDLVQKQAYNNNNNNTTTIVPRDTITDHANDESVVAEESKELIKDSHPEGNQKLFEVWKLNRIRHKREISKRKMIKIDENTKITQYQQHYEQIAEVVEWAIDQKYCTKDDATLKLQPIFDNASKSFSVPVGLIKSDEGRQVFKDAFAEPADRNHNLLPSDPGYYNEEAQAETRNRNKEKARQVREQGAAYGWSKTDELHRKADEIHKRSKPVTEPAPEPEQVEETKSSGNGGGGSMSPAERKAWLREKVHGLNDVQSVKKSGFGNATEVIEETKKKIREAQSTQMDLFDWSGLDSEWEDNNDTI